MIWPHGDDALTEISKHLKSIIHSRIHFTTGKEVNVKLPFFDVYVKRRGNGRFGHHVYRKPAIINRYLLKNFNHHLPRHKYSQKKISIRGTEAYEESVPSHIFERRNKTNTTPTKKNPEHQPVNKTILEL